MADKPAPLLARIRMASDAVRYTSAWHAASVLNEAADEIKRLRRELAAEKRRPKWNGKT